MSEKPNVTVKKTEAELDELVARKVLGWRTILEAIPELSGKYQQSLWIDPAIGFVELPRFCSNSQAIGKIFAAIEPNKRDKFLSVLPEVVYEETGSKFDLAWWLAFSPTDEYCRCVCIAALRVHGVKV